MFEWSKMAVIRWLAHCDVPISQQYLGEGVKFFLKFFLDLHTYQNVFKHGSPQWKLTSTPEFSPGQPTACRDYRDFANFVMSDNISDELRDIFQE